MKHILNSQCNSCREARTHACASVESRKTVERETRTCGSYSLDLISEHVGLGISFDPTGHSLHLNPCLARNKRTEYDVLGQRVCVPWPTDIGPEIRTISNLRKYNP